MGPLSRPDRAHRLSRGGRPAALHRRDRHQPTRRLELGNLFCESKERAQVFRGARWSACRLWLSATETYRDVIEDGVSGLLARDTAEWRRALELLIGSQSRRETMGDAARSAAQARFSLAAVVPRAIAALGSRQPAAAPFALGRAPEFGVKGSDTRV